MCLGPYLRTKSGSLLAHFAKWRRWQGAHSHRNSGGGTRGAAWLARERRRWLPDGFFARDRHRIQAGGLAAPGSGRLGPRGRSPGHVAESPGGRKSHREGRPRATALCLAGRAGPHPARPKPSTHRGLRSRSDKPWRPRSLSPTANEHERTRPGLRSHTAPSELPEPTDTSPAGPITAAMSAASSAAGLSLAPLRAVEPRLSLPIGSRRGLAEAYSPKVNFRVGNGRGHQRGAL